MKSSNDKLGELKYSGIAPGGSRRSDTKNESPISLLMEAAGRKASGPANLRIYELASLNRTATMRISPGGSRRSATKNESPTSLVMEAAGRKASGPSNLRVRTFRGSTLMVVLVILALVGMLTLQSVQSMILVRQTDQRAQRVMQAQELIELGQLWLRLRANRSVETLTQPQMIRIETPQGRGTIELQWFAEEDEQPASQVRLVATFPIEAANPTTATWISPTGYLRTKSPATQPAGTTDPSYNQD